jgi:hypothetical protein
MQKTLDIRLNYQYLQFLPIELFFEQTNNTSNATIILTSTGTIKLPHSVPVLKTNASQFNYLEKVKVLSYLCRLVIDCF